MSQIQPATAMAAAPATLDLRDVPEVQPSGESCVLDIGGMTCAACVNRVEKALKRVDGVQSATVNLAAETAAVSFDPAVVDLVTLTETVSRAGYTGTPRPSSPKPPSTTSDAFPTAPRSDGSDDEAKREAAREARKDAELSAAGRSPSEPGSG